MILSHFFPQQTASFEALYFCHVNQNLETSTKSKDNQVISSIGASKGTEITSKKRQIRANLVLEHQKGNTQIKKSSHCYCYFVATVTLLSLVQI